MDFPFRFHLRIVPPGTREEARQRLEIIRKLKHAYWFDNQIIERIIELGDEELFLFALRAPANPFTPYSSESYERIGRIVQWAISVMRGNGEVWNPIVDELVAQDVIRKLKNYRTRHRIDDDSLPDVDELTTGLASWIETQQDPKAFEDLFTFWANAVHVALARHARVMSDEVFEKLITDYRLVRVLAGNAYLPDPYRERIATKAWEEYRNGVRRKKRSSEAQDASIVLGELARSGPGLPAEIRNAIIKRQRRVANPDWQHIDFLVDDRGLTRSDAMRLIPLPDSDQTARLIRREVLTENQAKKLLATREVAGILLGDRTTSGVWIDHIVSAHSTSRFMLWRAANHPALQIETIRRMASLASDWPDVIKVLIDRPESLEDPVAREAIMSRPHSEVVAMLLPKATPEEYPRLLARIADASPRQAVEHLENTPPPRGTVMPPDLVARLLRSENSEVRIKAITLLSHVDLGPATREPVPGQAAARRI